MAKMGQWQILCCIYFSIIKSKLKNNHTNLASQYYFHKVEEWFRTYDMNYIFSLMIKEYVAIAATSQDISKAFITTSRYVLIWL